MGDTSRGYPYPELIDAPNGPAQIRALAEAVDVDVAAVEAAAGALIGLQGTGLLGSRNPAEPLRVRCGVVTLTSNAQGIITITTGLPTYVASIQLTQAGVSISAYAHFIVRTDAGTPGAVQAFVGNSLGQGYPNTSVAVSWVAVGQ